MRFSFLFFFLLFIFSCKSDKPKDILPEEKMTLVLWDVMRADELAMYQNGLDTAIRLQSRNIGYYQQILSAHKITKEEFKRSFEYYEQHPGKLKVILDSLKSDYDPALAPAVSPLKRRRR